MTLARAVDRYDPRHLFPQPPGYPLFILQSKILRATTGSVEHAFYTGVVLATAATLFAFVALSRSMFDTWIFGAMLLVVNPVFLFTGMTSAIRVYLAAISAIVAWLCWRAWNGDARAAFLAAVALGIGSGYRPELLALLFPLFAISAWRAKRLAPATILLAAIAAIWIGFLLSRFPDWHAFRETFSHYVSDQTRDTSLIMGAAEPGWIRTLFRVAMWNGTAIFGWIALIPLVAKIWKRNTLAFLALWIVPSIAFHALIHAEDPDQTLSTIPAFCMLGGAVLASFWNRNRDVAVLGIASAVVINIALFLAPFPLSANRTSYKPAVDALWQTSFRETRDVRSRTEAVIAALKPFESTDRTVVMWNRSRVTWRALSYYYPKLTFCLLMDDRHAGTRPHAAFWRNLELLDRSFGDPAVISLGDADQLVWIMGRLSPIQAAIAPQLDQVAEGVWQSKAAAMNIPGYRLVW